MLVVPANQRPQGLLDGQPWVIGNIINPTELPSSNSRVIMALRVLNGLFSFYDASQLVFWVADINSFLNYANRRVGL